MRGCSILRLGLASLDIHYVFYLDKQVLVPSNQSRKAYNVRRHNRLDMAQVDKRYTWQQRAKV